MSKIMNLFKEPDSICVFDIDGVLIPYEYGELNHNICKDEEWDKNPKYYASATYAKVRPVKTIQEIINSKDSSLIFACSKASQMERAAKKKAVIDLYGIKDSHIIFVANTTDKLSVLNNIKAIYPTLEDYKIILVDDTVKTLTYVQENSNFSTMHVSSFLE